MGRDFFIYDMTHVCVYICICVCMYVCMCVCMFVCIMCMTGHVLDALVYLHKERHIIHRDIKPSNVLLNHQVSHDSYKPATHCNALQHTATHSNNLYTVISNHRMSCWITRWVSHHQSWLMHVTATHFNTLQHTLKHTMKPANVFAKLHPATPCNTHCNTHWTHYEALQYLAEPPGESWHIQHCNTLQHTATQCNTPQICRQTPLWVMTHWCMTPGWMKPWHVCMRYDSFTYVYYLIRLEIWRWLKPFLDNQSDYKICTYIYIYIYILIWMCYALSSAFLMWHARDARSHFQITNLTIRYVFIYIYVLISMWFVLSSTFFMWHTIDESSHFQIANLTMRYLFIYACIYGFECDTPCH